MISDPNFKDLYYETLDKMLEDLDCLNLMEVRKNIFELENIISNISSLPDLFYNKINSYSLIALIVTALFCIVVSYFLNINVFFAVFISICVSFMSKRFFESGAKSKIKGFQDDSDRVILKVKFVLEQYREKERELSQDRSSDRELARELKRKRSLNQIDNESLIYQYGQMQAIQNQSNQQAYMFFQQAQQALSYGKTYDVESSLDQLERALGV